MYVINSINTPMMMMMVESSTTQQEETKDLIEWIRNEWVRWKGVAIANKKKELKRWKIFNKSCQYLSSKTLLLKLDHNNASL